MAERGAVIGARVIGGIVAVGVAAAVVAAVGLVPFPVVGAPTAAVTVEPDPADEVRACPGAIVRLGDETGENADVALAVGVPQVRADAVDADLDRRPLRSADPAAGSLAAPESLRIEPTPGGDVAGAQSQIVDAPDFSGLSAAVCAEPSSSIWLVGGATTVGRTTAILLANPTDVDARVTLTILAENGPTSAPGLTGIDVPAGGQRVLSLAGFAPGVASPVVHVAARGGRVVAALQHSIVRGLDAVGVELAGAAADPAESLVIPGIRIVDSLGTNRASALGDWQDVGPAIRVGVPGDEPATVTVRVVPESGGAGTSFELDVAPRSVTELPLDAEFPADGGEPQDGQDFGLADGVYTVYVDADVPVVAAARISTAADSGGDPAQPDAELAPPASDLAWFVAAPALSGSALVVVPDGPSPMLTIANPTDAAVEVEVAARTGTPPVLVTVDPGGSTSLAVQPGGYELRGVEGLVVGVSLAGSGRIAGYVVSPERPVAGSIVVRPY